MLALWLVLAGTCVLAAANDPSPHRRPPAVTKVPR
jgi:hypothetical protein